MPVQDVRSLDMPANGGIKEEARSEAAQPRPAAVDAVRWGTTLLTQLGLDPRAISRTGSRERTAA
jgi:hypothetical protein